MNNKGTSQSVSRDCYKLKNIALGYISGILLIKGLCFLVGTPSPSILSGVSSLALCLLIHTMQIAFPEWPLFIHTGIMITVAILIGWLFR